jgi:large subunit ribosomal protein L18
MDPGKIAKKRAARARRRSRGRKTVVGSPERPRLVVHRSLRNIEAQIIDDHSGHSLVGISTLSRDFEKNGAKRVEQGRELGKMMAEKAKEKGINRVVFDRAGFLYHGIVKAVADGAREGGLSF